MVKKVLYIATVVALSACSATKEKGVAATGNDAGSKAAGTTVAVGETAAANIAFWGRLLNEVCIRSTQANICVSPLSAQLAMAMVANGAEGKTKEEICGTMQLAPDMGSRSKDLASNDSSCKVEMANSIWINEKLDVKEQFVATNKEQFDAQVERVKFDTNAVDRINGWCNEKTNGKIPTIIEEVKERDMMYLLNAIYFKAVWQEPFAKHNTIKQKFTTEEGKDVEVDMMTLRKGTPYYSDSVITMAAKNYNGGYSMLLVLPNEGITCGEAAIYLAENFEACMKGMERRDVQLSLPKFTSDFGISLKPVLADMGIKRAFGNKAQFGGISKTPLLISDVMQKTFISVDEEGTEAAAVTSVRVGLLSAGRPPKVEILTLDRPFIYTIIDYNNEVLFAGKVGDPTKK